MEKELIIWAAIVIGVTLLCFLFAGLYHDIKWINYEYNRLNDLVSSMHVRVRLLEQYVEDKEQNVWTVERHNPYAYTNKKVPKVEREKY